MRADDRAAVRRRLDQALGLEHQQRLADRRPADPELARELLLLQARPGLEPAVEDRLADQLRRRDARVLDELSASLEDPRHGRDHTVCKAASTRLRRSREPPAARIDYGGPWIATLTCAPRAAARRSTLSRSSAIARRCSSSSSRRWSPSRRRTARRRRLRAAEPRRRAARPRGARPSRERRDLGGGGRDDEPDDGFGLSLDFEEDDADPATDDGEEEVARLQGELELVAAGCRPRSSATSSVALRTAGRA